MRCRGRSWSFDAAYPLFSYAGRARTLITAYKKAGRRSLAPFIAGLFAEAIEGRWKGWTIVPVPPRPGKAGGRDQVEEIARVLERRGYPVARPLRRSRSEEQKSLGRSERGLNAKRAYSLAPGAAPPSLALLVDDVVTTCSTLDACALALKDGGSARVEALAFAAD
jgi:predicted amidophosphoribosyltransferase